MRQRNNILVPVSLLLALGACEEKDKGTPKEANEPKAEVSQPPEQESNIEKIAESPKREYGNEYGKTMTLQGEVDKVLNERAFSLAEKNALWGDSVLVVLQDAPVQPLREGVEAKVTGTVMKFVEMEVEKEVGWDLDEEIEAEYEEKPIVVAKTLSEIIPTD